jgi:hypothetical protein
MDERFSVTLLPLCIRLYSCSKQLFHTTVHPYEFYRIHQDVLTITLLEDEVTLYLYVKPDDPINIENHQILRRTTTSDPRLYYVFDIHEDVPGIDHIGIIHRISKYFLQKQIPILYVNTYGHNLVFVSEDHYADARQILQDIGRLT